MMEQPHLLLHLLIENENYLHEKRNHVNEPGITG